MLGRTVIFLICNFAALGLGGIFTSDGVVSEWYLNLDKAPWTPPGWFFGVAWTTIMVCYSLFMASLWSRIDNKRLLLITYIIQWILNVGWNPVFFELRATGVGLLIISALTVLVAWYQFAFIRNAKAKALLMSPYLIWLLIATSLNAYVVIYN